MTLQVHLEVCVTVQIGSCIPQHVNDYDEEDDDNNDTSDFPTNMEILLRPVRQ